MGPRELNVANLLRWTLRGIRPDVMVPPTKRPALCLPQAQLVIVMVLALAAACGGERAVCDPGATQPCWCSPGAQGIQNCRNDRLGWGECAACTSADRTPSEPSLRSGMREAPTEPAGQQPQVVPVAPDSIGGPGDGDVCERLLAAAEDLHRRHVAVSNVLRECDLADERAKDHSGELWERAKSRRQSARSFHETEPMYGYWMEQAKKAEDEARRVSSQKCDRIRPWPYSVSESGELQENAARDSVDLEVLERRLAQSREQAFAALRLRRKCAGLLNDVNWKAKLGVDSSRGVSAEVEIAP